MLVSAFDKSDFEFMEAVSRRDPKALESMYDRYSRVIYSLFVRITRDQGVAEDLVQEFFLRIWNRARAFDGSKGSVAAWLLSIARNMAIDQVRSAPARFSVRVQPIDGLDGRFQLDHSADCESNMYNRRLIWKAMLSLTSNQRRAIELGYFEGFSQTEIAALLRVPLGTVKSWMRSGLGALRAAMAFDRGIAADKAAHGEAISRPFLLAS